MVLPRSNLPKSLILSYWKEVRRLLCEQYKLSQAAASSGIANYQKMLIHYKIGDILYHSPIEETAEGIVVGEYVDAAVKSSRPKTKAKAKAKTTPSSPRALKSKKSKTVDLPSPATPAISSTALKPVKTRSAGSKSME